MNPANFQNMGGPPPGPQGSQRQAGPSQNIRVQQHIYRMLHLQQTPLGWQTAVPLEKRTMTVWQLVSSLRLIKADMDIQQAINVAVTFEQKTFHDSPDQTSYEQLCHQKLKDITETRSKQANKNPQQFQNPQQAQMNMTPQQMQMQGMVQNQNPGQFQQGFPNPQLQHAMQLQQQLSQQSQPQMLNPQSALQPAPNQHPPQPQTAQPNGLPNFTPGEQQEIHRMAQIIAQNTPKDRLEQIQNQVQAVAPNYRQNPAMQNVDPLTYYFRNQATHRYIAQKARLANQRNQVTGAPGMGLMPQQSRSTPQNLAPQAAGAPPSQNFDSSKILVQQQNALRSQEAGQMVVPASNSQAVIDQPRNVRGTAQQPNGQGNGGRPMQNPTQPFYPQPNTQQVHMQPQSNNYGNIPNQSPQLNLQGQPHGLGTPGRTPQQNQSMPNLNRAFGSPNQQAQAAVNMWGPQRPLPPQQKDQHQINSQQPMQPSGQLERPNAGQQRPRSLMLNMPPEMQQRLASMPEEQRNNVLAQLQERQRLQMLQRHQVIRDNAGKPGPNVMGMQPGQPPPAMLQQPTSVQQNVPLQRPQQQQHPNMNLLDQHRVANIALTDEQVLQMDRQNFPIAIFNGALSTLPKDVKTWGQLKHWVAQNQSTLPSGSLAKLRGLQGLHYENISNFQRGRMHQGHVGPQSQVGPNATGQVQVQVQGNPQSQAPQAQMIAPPNNAAPLVAPNTPRMQNPAGTPALPQPTPQEIQASRARLPDQLKALTDEQIRVQILKQRQHELLKITLGHPGMTPQQQAHINQLQRVQQQQPAQPIQFQPPVNPKPQPAPPQAMTSRQQPQPSPRPSAAPKASGAKQPQAPRAASKQGQPNQKGIKRNSNDDVIEVPNPNVATPAARAQPLNAPQPSQPSRPGVLQNPNAPSQRTELDISKQRSVRQTTGSAPGQPQNQGLKPNGQGNSGPQRTEEQTRKEAQLTQIYGEVARSTPKGNPVAIAPPIRQRMVQMLGENTKLMSRIPNALPIFFSLIPEEAKFRDLIRTHFLASYQYRDKTYQSPAENFTVSMEELEAALKKLNHWFGWMVEQINARKGLHGVQVPGQPQNQPSAQQPQTQPAKESMPVLNAENLQQQQLALQHARAANLQRNHSNASVAMQKNLSNNSARTPAAPTSTHAPFSFGGQPPQPPHGVPTAYAERPNELTQDKLQIPTAKRRKGNQAPSAASTPVLAQGTPAAKSSPQVTKVESPEVQRHPPASVMLKCPDPDCAMSAEEFTTQADLDAHQNQIHPNFTDPLEFCLESIRMGLNLDENGKSKPRPEAANADGPSSSEATQMKKSASMQGQAAMKQESATPMTRIPTQTGPSPASNLLKTPQTANVKTPASDAKSAPKDGKPADPKASQAPPKTPTPAAEDPWAGSNIGPSTINSAFSGLANLNGLGPWTKVQNTLTPESSLSSGNTDKNSPRPSDISENDAVNISINVDDSNWMPSEWFMGSGMEGFGALHMQSDLEDIDWGFDDEEARDTGDEMGNKGKDKKDEFAPSKEWLKMYAPERV